MGNIKLPYKVRKFIRAYEKDINKELLEVTKDKLGDSNKAYLYITDLSVIVDYIMDNNEYSRGFYMSIIDYCIDFLSDNGYYAESYFSDEDSLDNLYDLEDYKDTDFRPMITVFKNKEAYKRSSLALTGGKTLGILLGILCSLEER